MIGAAALAEDEYNRLQERAARRTQYRLNNGLIPRLDGNIHCVDCGKPATCYDHRDYQRPDEVEPVCRACNARRGPALPGHSNWSAHNNWRSLGGGDGDAVELNGRLAVDLNIDLLEQDMVAQTDPDWLIAVSEMRRLRSAGAMGQHYRKHKVVSHNGETRCFTWKYSAAKKQSAWSIRK